MEGTPKSPLKGRLTAVTNTTARKPPMEGPEEFECWAAPLKEST